jgi:hypothetical protein
MYQASVSVRTAYRRGYDPFTGRLYWYCSSYYTGPQTRAVELLRGNMSLGTLYYTGSSTQDEVAFVGVYEPTGFDRIIVSNFGYGGTFAIDDFCPGDACYYPGFGRPVTGDYDGDRKADVTIYRPSFGEWWGVASGTSYNCQLGYLEATRGAATHEPAPGDYDGDGKADVAVYQSDTGDWWLLESSNGFNWQAGYRRVTWGGPGKVAVPADYDGDGKTDVAVHQSDTGDWWLLESANGYNWQAGYTRVTWGGVPGDVPIGRARQ